MSEAQMRTKAANQNQRDHTAVVIVHTFVVSFTIEPVCTHFTHTQLMSFVASANRLYLHGQRALSSASSSRLVVPMFRLSTVGSRTFNVSGPRIWNGLPKDVVSAPTFSSFRRRLKHFLFQQSYPDIVI